MKNIILKGITFYLDTLILRLLELREPVRLKGFIKRI